jgi:hypothetical protein
LAGVVETTSGATTSSSCTATEVAGRRCRRRRARWQ